MVLHRQERTLVTVCILEVLHSTIILKLRAERKGIPSGHIEHGERVANVQWLTGDRRVLEQGKRTQERGAEKQTEINELVIGQSAQFLLERLSCDPEEGSWFEIDSSDQFVDAEEQYLGWTEYSI